MKATILIVAGILSTVSSFAQGTINFNNNVPGMVVTRVYWETALSGISRAGNGPEDTPAGPTSYAGAKLLEGSSFSAQLFAANGVTTDPYTLQPAYPIRTFRTGAEAGFVNPVTATLTGVPADAVTATVQLRVWYNEGGATGWESSGIRAASPLFNVNAIGGLVNPPATLLGLQSFSIPQIPEPSTTGLAILGTAVLWCCSRRRAACAHSQVQRQIRESEAFSVGRCLSKL